MEGEGVLPLEGVRVIELSRMIAGPTAGMLLADLGADVIKIEPPTGDDVRYMNWRHRPDAAPFFQASNRNKRSVVLDLRDPRAVEILDRLVESADVLTHNFGGSLADSIGIGEARLRGLNPRLIYCAVSGFGDRGPWADRLGIDSLVQAMGGLMSVTGMKGGPPIRVGAPVVDTTSGVSLAAAILAALLKRERTGEGETISISLLGQVSFMQGPLVGYAHDSGRDPERLGNGSPLALIIEGHASDGTLLMGLPTDKFWARLCNAVGAPELIDAEGLRTQSERIENQDRVNELINRYLPSRTREEWLDIFAELRIPSAPVLSYHETLEHPQVVASNFFLEFEDEGGNRGIGASAPWSFGSGATKVRKAPPTLGLHTAEVLSELGLSPEEIAKLHADGVTRGEYVEG